MQPPSVEITGLGWWPGRYLQAWAAVIRSSESSELNKLCPFIFIFLVSIILIPCDQLRMVCSFYHKGNYEHFIFK